jgi:hypothetical protein
MSISSKTPLVTAYGEGYAFGNFTATDATTKTFAGAGVAIGFAEAVAVAEGTTTALPATTATTHGSVDGGYTTTSHTGHVDIEYPYGPTPVSLSASVTFVTTHGAYNHLSDHPLSANFYDYGLL